MMVHLIDGTYELFRHFYGLRRFNKAKDAPYGAVIGVLHGVLQMIEQGDTYIGVATDHVIESFRNRLWAGYKTGAGIERALLAQFHPLEEALAAMGVAVWPMIELEADDALASAAYLAAKDKKVEKVAIWTPDKDLAQCVRDTRAMQIDGRRKIIRDAAGVREKFGVDPPLIPDLLALVGDAADGYPGIAGIGMKGAAELLNRYGPIEKFPANILRFRFIARRIVIFASEDVGLADPEALPLAIATQQAVEFVGLPEARIPLAHATAYMCRAKKSREAYEALGAATEEIENEQTERVPERLKNKHFP
ncbi:MAG TPA: 5'-3' exonuclease H3TH domain-containing protein, partial [Chthoniobacterales bacterium]